MDIVKITMNGYGCEINRGIVPNGKEKKLESSLNDVWFKNVFEKLGEKTKIKKVINEIGLIKGDVLIEVNGEILIETSIESFETLIGSEQTTVEFPKTNGVVITSIQHQEGVISDTIFILDEDFDINKLKIIKKDIKDRVDNTIISSLYCEMYYEDEIIPMMGNLTDLRMSRLFFEKRKENE